ncbi:hypothetical protein BWI97_01895 [Siphonobacter sp. BAB-5405]|nr:hypothetical protein BWI97_01895 [Siphonobacter sp. BAB-5405]
MNINLRLSYFSWLLIIVSTLATALLSFVFYLGSEENAQTMLDEQGWVLVLLARWGGFSILAVLFSVVIAIFGTALSDVASFRQTFRISVVCNSMGAFLGTVAFVIAIIF